MYRHPTCARCGTQESPLDTAAIVVRHASVRQGEPHVEEGIDDPRAVDEVVLAIGILSRLSDLRNRGKRSFVHFVPNALEELQRLLGGEDLASDRERQRAVDDFDRIGLW